MEHLEQPGFAGTDRYAIRRHIGGGAMGLVYEAWDRKRKAPVALKTLRTVTPEGLYRLKQEFRALADLSHPNLVALYELVGSEEAWFIVMELVQGRNFLGWVREEEVSDRSLGHTVSWVSQPIDSSDALAALETEEVEREQTPPSLVKDLPRLRDALIQMVRGIAALHAAGKLHRDLKPSNVLVTPEGRVVLVDFGLVYDTDRTASELSRVDKVVGTAAFMPPEQARGELPSQGSDLYCVGVMLFQGLTGRLPFEGPLVQMLLKKQQEDPPAPSSLVEGVPPDLDQLCVALLNRDPPLRPSARETLEQLGESPDVATDLTTRFTGVRRLEGREAQRQELEDAWAEARAGRATSMLIRGRSGMGKTSLIRHFLVEVRKHEDVSVLRGRCYERESVPFKAFDNLVDRLRRRLERLPDEDLREAVLPDDMGALARVFPSLSKFVKEPEVASAVPTSDPADLRQRAFTAFRILIRNLTAVRPTIVFLDDVQWGDIDSARLLSALLRDLRECRLLVLVSYRTEDEDSSAFLLHFLRDPSLRDLHPRTLELEELPDAKATAVARGLLGDALADPAEAAVWIARESGGNPFLLSELASAIKAAGERGEEMPDLSSYTLEDLFRARHDALEKAPRLLMQMIALAGRPLSLRIVCRAAGCDEESLDALGVLRTWRLVRTSRGPLGGWAGTTPKSS
ncbi:MAG: protein kinase [Deltaproteobacteria bacterium]|nr:protein kinase [Deltaproteobacteria bacterium]